VFSGESTKAGKVAPRSEVDGHGIVTKQSTPYHFQTRAKVERLIRSSDRLSQSWPSYLQPLRHGLAELRRVR
jgi:hypothetical protein